PVRLPDGSANRSSVIGRGLAADIKFGKYKLAKGTEINGARLRELADVVGDDTSLTVPVRTALHCRAKIGACKECFGWSMATREMSEIGAAAGTVAAQSIAAPGTQLPRRTFHTGSVAGADITRGLPRVVEL